MNIIDATKASQEKRMAMRRPHWDTDLWDGEKYYPKCFYPTNGYGSTLQTVDSYSAWLDHAEFSTNDLLAEDWELCELPFDLDVTLGLWDGIPFDNSEELMAS